MEEKKKPVVIFAERNLTWSRKLRVELRRLGATVFAVTSMQEMLQHAEHDAPDLVVLDDDLDDVDSTVRISLLRGRFPQVEIVLLEEHLFHTPRGVGLGLLYCGTRSVSHESLLNVLVSALPGLGPLDPSHTRETPKVMCVDDDDFYLQSLARLLHRYHYQAFTYQDPEAALASIPEVNPDLIILDILMPGMSGLDLAKEIHEIYQEKIPIVMLTARDSDGDMAEGYKRGACYYISKPCDPRTVINIVDYLVGDIDSLERKLLEVEL